jgi:hypothetical protein
MIARDGLVGGAHPTRTDVSEIGFVRGDSRGPNRLRSGRLARPKSASFGEPAARGFALRVASRATTTKLPKSGTERAESPSRVAWDFSEGRLSAKGLDTSESRHKEKTRRAGSLPSCDASSPRASPCQRISHIREHRKRCQRHAANLPFSPSVPPLRPLLPANGLDTSERSEPKGCAERWVSGAFPTASIKDYREEEVRRTGNREKSSISREFHQ